MASGASERRSRALSSVLVAAEVPSLFGIFLPTIAEVSKVAEDDAGRQKIRAGYVMPAALGLGLGLLVSAIEDDLTPFIGCALTTAAMLVAYEREVGA